MKTLSNETHRPQGQSRRVDTTSRVSGDKLCTSIRGIHSEMLKAIPPYTFLFQPPVKDIRVICAYGDREISIQQPAGVTFGTLFDTVEKLRLELELEFQKDPGSHFMSRLSRCDHRCARFSIEVEGAILVSTEFVQSAAKA